MADLTTDLVTRLRIAGAEHCRLHSLQSSLLGEAADEIERLNEQLMKAFGIWPNGSNVHSGTCGHEPKEGNEYGSSY